MNAKEKIVLGDMTENGSYSCAKCATELFRASEKSATASDAITFERPIDPSRLQFKKQPDASGQREMRCVQCKSMIGRFLSSGVYRVDKTAINFKRDTPTQAQALEVSKGDTSSARSPFPTLEPSGGSRAQLIGGVIVGIVLGAAGALLICKSSCGAPDASYTVPPINVASSTEETSASPTAPTESATPDEPESGVPPIEVSTSSPTR